MRRPVFEATAFDAAGRLGRLSVPRSDLTVETPALLPVVNPHLQLIEPRRLGEEFGAEILITNAYVLYQSRTYRDAVLDRGVHDVLDFPGAIMTDSGSFQLAEYGHIDVETPEILSFQDAIGSDIATPVDVPTPPDADRAVAEADLERTREAIATAAAYDAGEMLITAPVQGGSFRDLRTRAAVECYESDRDIYPIGAVVPLLTEYRFGEVVEVVTAAKEGLGTDAPVHLFGAGHPMMFALAVALGCDLFDSAAYALYAREDRYLTTSGTESLDTLAYFPCHCPVCATRTPSDLREESSRRRTELLASHNLHVSFGELRRVKQAIRDGGLFELVEERVRSHPDLLDGYRALLERTEYLERTDPARSRRPFFYVSADAADRPEVVRHQRRLSRLPRPDSILLIDIDAVTELPEDVPWLGQGSRPTEVIPPEISIDEFDGWWYVCPPFGPMPPELAYTYPLTAERPDRLDDAAYRHAVEGIVRLLSEPPPERVTLVHDGWPSTVLADVPPSTEVFEPRSNAARKGS